MTKISDDKKELIKAFISFNININNWLDEPQYFDSENKRYSINDRFHFIEDEKNIFIYSRIIDKELNKTYFAEFVAEYNKESGTKWIEFNFKQSI